MCHQKGLFFVFGNNSSSVQNNILQAASTTNNKEFESNQLSGGMGDSYMQYSCNAKA